MTPEQPRDPKTRKIVVQLATEAAGGDLAHLRAQLSSDVTLRVGLEGGDDASDPANILVQGRPTVATLDAFPALEAVVVPFAGIPRTTLDLLRERPALSLHNLHHNAAPTAELAIALLLAAAKRVVPADRALRNHDWSIRYEDDAAPLLCERTALVVGCGAVGSRVVMACKGLGMTVRGVRRTADPSDPNVFSMDELECVLPEADVIFLTVPGTPETEGLLGERELALLPPGAILVNVARGPVVDEAALFAALESGRLGGAGLDVWYHYPEDEESRKHTRPSEFPFSALDNVVLSPHRAGHGDATERLRADHLAKVLNAAARPGPIPNEVDKQTGY